MPAPDDELLPVCDEERADNNRVVAYALIILGGAMSILTAAMAISHFVYGAPVHIRHHAALAAEGVVLFCVILFGSAGLLLLGAGIRLWRACRPPRV